MFAVANGLFARLSTVVAVQALLRCRCPRLGKLGEVEKTPASGRIKTAYGAKVAVMIPLDPW